MTAIIIFFILTHCGLMMPYVNIAWVKIGSASGKDGLLPDDTKPSLEPMLTYYSSVAGDWGLF